MFISVDGSWKSYKTLMEIIKRGILWNYVTIRKVLNSISVTTYLSPVIETGYSVYLVSLVSFILFYGKWEMDRLKRKGKQPHPCFFQGNSIDDSASCNPSEETYRSIYPNVQNLADIRNQFTEFGNKQAMYYTHQWFSYSHLLKISDILADIVEKHSHTSNPICVMGDFSSIKCSTIIGLCSKGRSVVFVPSKSSPAEMTGILEEQRCEIILLKHYRLGYLEDALNNGLCRDLHVVIYTDDDYVEKMEVGNSNRAEESLVEEYNLEVISLSHMILSDYNDYHNDSVIKDTRDLSDKNALIVYNSNHEAIHITHENLIAAASALIEEYSISQRDVILCEPVSVASTLSLFIATMMCGASISFTDHILTICGEVQPTILSASHNSYYLIYKEVIRLRKEHIMSTFILTPIRALFQNTQYYKLVRQRHISQLLGDNLRICLSFYSFHPLSRAGHALLCKMVGVPVSIVFGNTETCGVCTHSLADSKPFVCNSLRKSENNTLLISGANIAENSRMAEQYGAVWFNSGVSVRFVKHCYVLHYMPSAYDSMLFKEK